MPGPAAALAAPEADAEEVAEAEAGDVAAPDARTKSTGASRNAECMVSY